MKIALFDPYLLKFTQDMVNWWTANGHEVRIDRYYDPELVIWADVVWFDTCDNNILSATSPGEAILGTKFYDNREIPWDMHEMDLTGKKIIVRPIDIEVWQGHHAHANVWNLVTDCIFIAPHIRDMALQDSRMQGHQMKIHTIPCGLNMSKWKFKVRKPGKKVAIVAERWVSKGVDYAIQIAMKLPMYDFYWLGKNNDYHWEAEYLHDMIKRHVPNLHLEEEFVPDLDAWLDDKDYILSCSKKEAFGYNYAEAMAKGIKPVIHEFFGFEPLWGDSGYTWASIDQAVSMISNKEYDSDAYAQYLIDKGYDINSVMTKFMEVING